MLQPNASQVRGSRRCRLKGELFRCGTRHQRKLSTIIRGLVHLWLETWHISVWHSRNLADYYIRNHIAVLAMDLYVPITPLEVKFAENAGFVKGKKGSTRNSQSLLTNA